MSSTWVDFSRLLPSRGGLPRLADEHQIPDLSHAIRRHGMDVVEIDLASARSQPAVIQQLRNALWFPEWMGDSWDSIDDVGAELTEEWAFPLCIIVRGLDDLMGVDVHLGLNTVIHLLDISRGFGRDQLQVEVVFVS